jgi:site-specific DNA recombinase
MRVIGAAIYARVACATQQAKRAIVSQLKALRDHATCSGMEIIEEFADEGCSGLRLDRPGLDRMRGLAGHRGFDVLLTCGPDRLARSFALQVLVAEELERCGIRTIFLDRVPADDPLSKLMHQITGAVAEFERAKITERYRRGKLYRARCGEIVSPDVPFGYMKIPRRDGVAAHAEIQEAEAVVVRRIFDAYVKQNLTVRQIAKGLTLDRPPTPRNGGGQWSWSAVDRILHEEAYIGTPTGGSRKCNDSHLCGLIGTDNVARRTFCL